MIGVARHADDVSACFFSRAMFTDILSLAREFSPFGAASRDDDQRV
jgi:hypothetical protein